MKKILFVITLFIGISSFVSCSQDDVMSTNLLEKQTDFVDEDQTEMQILKEKLRDMYEQQDSAVGSRSLKSTFRKLAAIALIDAVGAVIGIANGVPWATMGISSAVAAAYWKHIDFENGTAVIRLQSNPPLTFTLFVNNNLYTDVDSCGFRHNKTLNRVFKVSSKVDSIYTMPQDSLYGFLGAEIGQTLNRNIDVSTLDDSLKAEMDTLIHVIKLSTSLNDFMHRVKAKLPQYEDEVDIIYDFLFNQKDINPNVTSSLQMNSILTTIHNSNISTERKHRLRGALILSRYSASLWKEVPGKGH